LPEERLADPVEVFVTDFLALEEERFEDIPGLDECAAAWVGDLDEWLAERAPLAPEEVARDRDPRARELTLVICAGSAT